MADTSHYKWTKAAVEAKVSMEMMMEGVAKEYPDALKKVDLKALAAYPFLANRKDIRNASPDPRFPNMNQTANCWTKFNTFIMCMNHFAEGGKAKCGVHLRNFKEICPDRQTSKWTDQINEGRWVGVAPKNPSIMQIVEDDDDDDDDEDDE